MTPFVQSFTVGVFGSFRSTIAFLQDSWYKKEKNNVLFNERMSAIRLSPAFRNAVETVTGHRGCGWPGSLVSVVIRVYFFTLPLGKRGPVAGGRRFSFFFFFFFGLLWVGKTRRANRRLQWSGALFILQIIVFFERSAFFWSR